MPAKKNYQPSDAILRRYAEVLVNFALNSGAGVKAGEVVQIVVPDAAKSLALKLQNVVLDAGAHPLIQLLPTGFDKDFFERANDAQLKFFPKKYFHERINLIDHSIIIIADVDPFDLMDIDPQKIFLARDAKKEYREWSNEKENNGKYTWTIGLWGVQAKAAMVGLSLEEYWQQIIQACFLDVTDPVAKWREIQKFQEKTLKKLNNLEIDYLKITGKDVDLTVGIGPERQWAGGSGRNIPSFEFFTSPDWRRTDGWIYFNQPVYRYGNMMSGVRLEFKNGKLLKATAEKGQKVLTQMLQTKDADKIGEFSLTDKRTSRISHVMAETLFDENIAGPDGNTHLALGMAYKNCYKGDPSKPSKKEWKKMGYNDSAEHTDIVSTTSREVTAHLVDGSTLTLYKDGKFVI